MRVPSILTRSNFVELQSGSGVGSWELAVGSRKSKVGRWDLGVEVGAKTACGGVVIRSRGMRSGRQGSRSSTEFETLFTPIPPYGSRSLILVSIGTPLLPALCYPRLSYDVADLDVLVRRRSPSLTSTLTTNDDDDRQPTNDDSRMTPMMHTLNFFIASKCGRINTPLRMRRQHSSLTNFD